MTDKFITELTRNKVPLSTDLIPMEDDPLGTALTQYVHFADLPYPPGTLYGCTLSNNGTDPTNDIDIAAGSCRDSTDAQNIVSAARTKRIDAAWAVGTNQGGLDTGSLRTQSATVTMTIASPCVVTWSSHGLSAGDRFWFTTTGALPTSVTAGEIYFVISAGLTASEFEFSKTAGGAAVNSSGTQSGTHTINVIDWYHLWRIKRSDTGVVDDLFSASPTAPTMPANYDYKRRVGSIIRAGGVIRPFTQRGNEFWLVTPVRDLHTQSITTSSTTFELASVPDGLVIQSILTVYVYKSGTTTTAYIRALTDTDSAVAYGAFQNITDTSAGLGAVTMMRIFTNTDRQIAARASAASTVLDIVTYGWVDVRDRL